MKMNFLKSACMVSALALSLGACEHLPNTGVQAQSTAPAASVTKVDGKYVVNTPIPSFYDYIIVETQMGNIAPRVVDMGQMVSDLSKYDVVFMGEAHGHVASHLVQAKVFSGLYQTNKKLALSMEQFERSQQGIMDDYLAGKAGEEKLFHEGKAWPHYRSSYRPLVEFAKNNGLPVIAAEVPGGMVSCVGEEGPAFLDRLKGESRKWIADELHVQEGPYKERYLSFMSRAAGHSVSDPNMTEEQKQEKRDRSFSAQVSRDDTMAMSMYDHLQANPGTQIMHTNGSFHSAALLGTAERLKMRDSKLTMANVHSILVDDATKPSFDADLVGEGQYILLIQNTPKRFVGMKEVNAFVSRTKKAINEKRCKY